MTEAFSDEALDPVSVNGATCALLGDRQAQPGMSLSVRANEQREIPIRKPCSFGENPSVFGWFRQTGGATKANVGKKSDATVCPARMDIPGQGVSRARPFARRARITFRPLRVAIRERKPWVRARLMRLG
jgi:hypothetical protein